MTIHIDPATGQTYEALPDGTTRWIPSQPGPPQGPPPRGGYDALPPPEPAKSHRGRTITLIVVAVFVIAGAIGSLTDSKKDEAAAPTGAVAPAASVAPSVKGVVPKSTPPKPVAKVAPKPQEPGLGMPVRDGKFEFTLTSLKRASLVGTKDFGQQAQGVFVLVHVKVTNIGDEAQTFEGSSQILFDTNGRKYNADDGAAIYLKDSQSFIKAINPGNSISGVVVFDVPKGTSMDKFEFHDSMFSGGTTVQLDGVKA